MENAIKEAIKRTAEKAQDANKSEDAMRFAQAALNLAHTLVVNANIPKEKDF